MFLFLFLFLFLLTAREGRVSAKRFARSSSRNPSTGGATSARARSICVSRAVAQRPFLKTKPAMLRVFYIGTNKWLRMFEHPYARSSDAAATHGHLKPTRV